MPNGCVLDAAPEEGSVTVMVAVPGSATRSLATVAVRISAVPKVVGTGTPFHCTTDELVNPVPPKEMLRLPPPATVYEGTRTPRVITGGGGGCCWEPLCPPPQPPVNTSARSIKGPAVFSSHAGVVILHLMAAILVNRSPSAAHGLGHFLKCPACAIPSPPTILECSLKTFIQL